jgi:hypothetical protein
MTRKKLPGAFCECYAKVRCGLSKAATLRCAAKRFVFTGIHPAQLNSRENCEHDSKVKTLELARRRLLNDKNTVILSEAKNIRSHFPTSSGKQPEMFRSAQHDKID